MTTVERTEEFAAREAKLKKKDLNAQLGWPCASSGWRTTTPATPAGRRRGLGTADPHGPG